MSAQLPAPVPPPQPLAKANEFRSEFDQKILQASDPREVVFLVQVRRELIQQDSRELKEREVIMSKRREYWFRCAFCCVTLAVGSILLGAGFTLSGFFVIGGGLAQVVPAYVQDFTRNIFKRGTNND